MKIYDFTLPELEYFRQTCNFTPDERTLFDYRSRELSIRAMRRDDERQHIHGEADQSAGE